VPGRSPTFTKNDADEPPQKVLIERVFSLRCLIFTAHIALQRTHKNQPACRSDNDHSECDRQCSSVSCSRGHRGYWNSDDGSRTVSRRRRSTHRQQLNRERIRSVALGRSTGCVFAARFALVTLLMCFIGRGRLPIRAEMLCTHRQNSAHMSIVENCYSTPFRS
jgi:hypothetical protein